ncbi:MAG: hypothetical protein HY22_13860 [[Candidatus Thermochlorobacteriaceae] bacterium GBChlB]|nr:MAG: hypothetical protein HY22_13860 [[Candidatus Thermochlorobacteriaceae] bacterium GBChlB]
MSRYVVYVCTNTRSETNPKPSCGRRGADALFQAMKDGLEKSGLDTVELDTSSCLGACENGCSILVHSDTTWYGGVTEADVPEIIEQHFKNNRPVERLFIKRLMRRLAS